MTKVERCWLCGGFVRQDDDGWLFPHLEMDSKTEYCTNRQPAEGEYPVGYDHDPWVMSGGLPTLGKDRR